jgi:hypothetical protein
MSAPTRLEVFALYSAMGDADEAFSLLLRSDPNRLGMRPGDFRYRSDLHSAGTRVAGEAMQAAVEIWRTAFRARNKADELETAI